jgi:hypothetical protein
MTLAFFTPNHLYYFLGKIFLILSTFDEEFLARPADTLRKVAGYWPAIDVSHHVAPFIPQYPYPFQKLVRLGSCRRWFTHRPATENKH